MYSMRADDSENEGKSGRSPRSLPVRSRYCQSKPGRPFPLLTTNGKSPQVATGTRPFGIDGIPHATFSTDHILALVRKLEPDKERRPLTARRHVISRFPRRLWMRPFSIRD